MDKIPKDITHFLNIEFVDEFKKLVHNLNLIYLKEYHFWKLKHIIYLEIKKFIQNIHQNFPQLSKDIDKDLQKILYSLIQKHRESFKLDLGMTFLERTPEMTEIEKDLAQSSHLLKCAMCQKNYDETYKHYSFIYILEYHQIFCSDCLKTIKDNHFFKNIHHCLVLYTKIKEFIYVELKLFEFYIILASNPQIEHDFTLLPLFKPKMDEWKRNCEADFKTRIKNVK